MNRTRIIFVGILAVTACVILSVVVIQFLNPDGNGETAVTGTTEIEVPSGSVLVSLASSNTKESWLNQVVEKFNTEQIETSGGSPIVVTVSHVTSGGSMNAILDGSSQPIAWSPGDQSWVDQANDTWRQRTNLPLASQSCATGSTTTVTARWTTAST